MPTATAMRKPRKPPKARAPKAKRRGGASARGSKPRRGRRPLRGGTTITHTCGHTQVHALEGMAWKREREQKRLAERVCTSCWASGRAEELEGLCEGVDLPPLTGSDAQILFARSIRALAVIQTKSAALGLDRERKAVGLQPVEDRYLGLVLPYFAGLTKAKWWIDRKESADLLAEVVPMVTLDELAAFREEITKVPECPF